MIAALIRWSLNNRPMVILLTLVLTGWGIFSLKQTPLDAIPDLSDLQVIIRTTYAGQAPEVVEDQITYPIATAMLSVPKSTVVRGYSFFADSFIYVLFEEGTDIYWARSRVLEYLSQVSGRLPEGVRPQLGPDATGVGWVYEYALVDRSGTYDLAQLRGMQDWFLKFQLQTVEGVSEVASVGGMVKQYQIELDPDRLRAFGLTVTDVTMAVERGNQEVGGSVIELAEAEYIVRARGYIQKLDDIRQIPVGLNDSGTPILLGDIAQVRLGPEMRRGIAELDGIGEVAGGIIVMRYGENAMTTIEAVKRKLVEAKKGLPPGVEIVETYDRSSLIQRSVDNLIHKLIEEFIVVTIICVIFLYHLRSAFVAIVILPLGILIAFIVMKNQAINANIMSLGGIAIAIGAMVDAAIVMIENAHKHMERTVVTDENRWEVIYRSSLEVGPALFFSLMIITLSFLPVFTLEAQEGKLFAPLAFTKTYSMAAAAGLSITLMPVLMGFFIRGHIPPEHKNPINRFLIAVYLPIIRFVLYRPKFIILLSLITVATAVYPLSQLGSEFMPDIDEGDILYMPTTGSAISTAKAGELLQLTDRLIKTVPEVKTVFGKAGRAETATDPAPLEMLETTIQLKPKDEWRPGMTIEKIKAELNKIVKVPSMANAWVMPIRTRIDMISTGIKTPLGIKVSGPDLSVIQKVAMDIERVVGEVPGTVSAFAERVAGGRYINIDIDRRTAARYGLNIADVQEVIDKAVGGAMVTTTVEGLERYPVNVRYPRSERDSVEELEMLPIITPGGAQVTLGDVAKLEIAEGPASIRSEDARRSGWIYVDIRGVDLGSYVTAAKQAVLDKVQLPPGYAVGWSGQYEYMLRAKERFMYVVPLTLVLILLLLYMNFKNFTESLMVMLSVPLALVGAFWLIYMMQFNMSAAIGVGLIALAGVAAEFGVVMLVYLDNAVMEQRPTDDESLRNTIIEGAVMRVRPKAMTAAVIIAGLVPIMIGEGTGSEVMQRIGAPMLGGMITAPLVSMVLIPALYYLWKSRELRRTGQITVVQALGH